MSAGKVKPDPRRPGYYLFTVDAAPVDGKRRQLMRRGFPTKKAAQDALDELKRRIHAGRGVVPSRGTYGELLVKRWLPTIDADPKLKPTTKAGYRSAAKHLVRECGAVRLDQLTGEHLDALYASLRAAGRSESLVHAVHVTAHKSLAAAMRWRLVGFNAADDTDSPGQPKASPVAWSAEQVATFLTHAEGDRWWPLWLCAATTAMRRGELVGLRWSDIDIERRMLTVANNVTVANGVLYHGTPKGNRARSISLDAGTVAALRSWKATQNAERLQLGDYWPAGDHVWTWPDGSLLHPNTTTTTFGRLVKQAGLPQLRLHALRHAWATAALDAGVHVKDVSQRLGHSSVRITLDTYTAPSDERDAAAAELVAELYSRKGTQ